MTIRGGIYCVGKLYPCPQRGLLEGVFSIYTVKPRRVVLLLQRLADIKIIIPFLYLYDFDARTNKRWTRLAYKRVTYTIIFLLYILFIH